ncbi:MAG: hypothetical protein QGF57_05030, partial [Candidatus Marinimicrobia bacterium]|nr:hypothetical protein [Candidatus Neomarinimicrobiota bacterium]
MTTILYKILGTFLLLGMAYPAVSLEIQNVDLDAGTLDIYMSNDEAVGGFQFELFGLDITGASGGSAGAAGFMISTSPSTILGFSITGATIPVGADILFQVTFENASGSEICFGEDTGGAGSNTISSAFGTYIAANWGECYCPGEQDACGDCGGNNVDNCFEDGSECVSDDDCLSDFCDSCGICGGTGIPEGDCDCDGNIIDCAGECGGISVEDECGVCGGDNSSCLDCAGIPNGDAVEDNCGTCDDDSSNDCVQDCAGVWGGTSENDDCSVCNGDNSTCTDCEGVIYGEAEIDNCGTCDDDSSNDCVQDCA